MHKYMLTARRNRTKQMCSRRQTNTAGLHVVLALGPAGFDNSFIIYAENLRTPPLGRHLLTEKKSTQNAMSRFLRCDCAEKR